MRYKQHIYRQQHTYRQQMGQRTKLKKKIKVFKNNYSITVKSRFIKMCMMQKGRASSKADSTKNTQKQSHPLFQKENKLNPKEAEEKQQNQSRKTNELTPGKETNRDTYKPKSFSQCQNNQKCKREYCHRSMNNNGSKIEYHEHSLICHCLDNIPICQKS